MVARVARTVAMMVLWPAASLAAPHPLREFDHAAVTQNVCPIVVVHANATIAAALRADDALARALARLRALGIDDGEFAQRAALGEVLRSGATIAEAAARGADEAHRLMALADDPNASGHGGDVREFATAMGVVFERDRSIAETLAGVPATLEARALRDGSAGFAAGADAAPPGGSGRTGSRTIDAQRNSSLASARTPSVSAIVHSAAADVEGRARDLSKDESRAATVVERAVTGC